MRAGSRWKLLVGLTAVVAIGTAAVAWGTFSSSVLYKPPLLKVVDFPVHGTVEDLTIENTSDEILILNPGHFQNLDPQSDPGCSGNGSAEIHCPSDGLERLRITTNDEDDSVVIALHGPLTKMNQRISLGDGEDHGFAGRGKQKILGGEGDDFLKGGPGPDLLIGGPGDDTCKGGPGKDVIKSC